MPTYDYQCPTCGTFEASHKMSDPDLSVCPKCQGTEVKKLVSAAGFALVGGGWYKSDYCGSSSKKSSSTGSADTAKTETAKTTPCGGGCKCH